MSATLTAQRQSSERACGEEDTVRGGSVLLRLNGLDPDPIFAGKMRPYLPCLFCHLFVCTFFSLLFAGFVECWSPISRSVLGSFM